MPALPSGQMVLPKLMKWLSTSRGKPLARTIARTLAEAEGLGTHDLAHARAPLRKKRHHGTSSPGATSMSDLDPELSRSELKAVYTTPRKKLAEKFRDSDTTHGLEPDDLAEQYYFGDPKAPGLLSGHAPSMPYLNLDKKISPNVLRDAATLLGTTPEKLYKAVTYHNSQADHLAREGSLLVGGKSKSGAPSNGALVRFLVAALGGRGGSRYGNPESATKVLKALGYEGVVDRDWYYASSFQKRSKYPETNVLAQGLLRDKPLQRTSLDENPLIKLFSRMNLGLTPNADQVYRAAHARPHEYAIQKYLGTGVHKQGTLF